MRYDAEHKARTRQKVLTVAKQAIRQNGLANLGVAAVMKDAGLTHGGFYAHFPSRDALIDAALEEMLEGAKVRFQRITDGLPLPVALATYLDMYLSAGHRDSGTFLCPLPILSTDMTRLEPARRAAYAVTADRLASLMRPMIEAADPSLDPDEAVLVSRSVVSEAVGALSLARAIGPTEQSDAILDASRTALKRRLGLPAVPAGAVQ
ncbi:MAG: TetR/AcrR family transcriptional regulator [Caulobacteraceae bacterium]|nr:TetR/AcrR family transcriptional regulator [Caulobacteraceae bacterium]